MAAIANNLDTQSQEYGIMITLQENLNLRIGRERWKKYITSMFWYYINMPINFTITLFTAITSGQVGTNATFLSSGTVFALIFTAFLLSTINTFFKLKENTEANYVIAQKYEEFANIYESIYFTPLHTDEDVLKRLIEYKKLNFDINQFCKDTNLEQINYISELLYMCGKRLFFKNRIKLIHVAERLWVLDGKPKGEEYHKNHLMEMQTKLKQVIVKEPSTNTNTNTNTITKTPDATRVTLDKITDHISLTITET